MKLLTWNIQWGRGADGLVDLDRIADHVRRLGDFDIVCLQEVSSGYSELAGNGGPDQFSALAALFPGFCAVDGVATDELGSAGHRRRFGNMILARFPVLQVLRHLLPRPCDPGVKSMQRIALEATLQTAAGPLRVTTTHLEYYSAPQRQAQIARLRQLHGEAVAQAHAPPAGAPEDGPFFGTPRGAAAILCGDCNFRPDAAEHVLMQADIDAATPPYRDAWQVLHPGQAHAPTVGLYDKQQWPGAPFTFDYFFVSTDLLPRLRRIEVDAASAASDHQPMWLEMA